MELSPVIIPIATILELVIFVLAMYIGYKKEKNYGYLFGITFFLFALFDYLGQAGLSADSLAIMNLIAVLAGLAGMYLLYQER